MYIGDVYYSSDGIEKITVTDISKDLDTVTACRQTYIIYQFDKKTATVSTSEFKKKVKGHKKIVDGGDPNKLARDIKELKQSIGKVNQNDFEWSAFVKREVAKETENINHSLIKTNKAVIILSVVVILGSVFSIIDVFL